MGARREPTRPAEGKRARGKYGHSAGERYYPGEDHPAGERRQLKEEAGVMEATQQKKNGGFTLSFREVIANPKWKTYRPPANVRMRRSSLPQVCNPEE